MQSSVERERVRRRKPAWTREERHHGRKVRTTMGRERRRESIRAAIREGVSA